MGRLYDLATTGKVRQPTPQQPAQEDLLSQALPLLFGIGGGVLGTVAAPGVGTVAGGAAGSAFGETLRQKLRGESDPGRIAGEAALGLIGGGVGKAASLALRGGKAVAQGAARRASASILKATPSAFDKAAESGIDLNRSLAKVLSRAKLKGDVDIYDELLGPVGRKSGGGKLSQFLAEEEGRITSTVKTAGSNLRIPGESIVKALKTERQQIAKELGGGERAAALDRIIADAQKKYAKGVTVGTARQTLKAANARFGDSILDDSTDAVARAAQKLEANTLRRALRERFPTISEALDNEQELIVLRKVLGRSRAKDQVTGLNAGELDLTRPGTVVDLIANNPRIATRIAPLLKESGASAAAPSLKRTIAGQTLAQSAARTVGSAFTGSPTAEGDIALDEFGLSDSAPLTSDFSAAAEQPLITKEKAYEAMIVDLQETGGKNISKIATLYKLFGPQAEKKLTATQQQNANSAQSGLRAIDSIEAMLKKDPSVLFKASVPFASQQNPFSTARREAADVLTRLRTGAALNEAEQKFYQEQLPQPFDSAETIAYKLQLFRELFRNIAAGKYGDNAPTTQSDTGLEGFLEP